MSTSWKDLTDEFRAQVSYAPLALDAVPQIRSQASATLRNLVPDSTGFRASCPFHVSDDPTSTTLRVNLDATSQLGIGFFKCYSCGRRGHWNVLANHVGIDMITGDANPEIKNLLMPVKVTKDEYRPPRGLLDWPGKPWTRENKDGSTTTISTYPFDLLGAKLLHMDAEVKEAFTFKGVHYAAGSTIPEVRAWLPVQNAAGENVAHVLALLSSRYPGSKKYLNASGPWSKRYLAFLHQIRRIESDRVVIVEGPADAMRLIDVNIPAIPLLGVTTWSDLKSEMLASMYSKAIVCLDGDAAGQPAQAAVAASLGEVMSVTTMAMPPKYDPASLPPQAFQQFTRAILSQR